jgi:hypothetical protein
MTRFYLISALVLAGFVAFMQPRPPESTNADLKAVLDPLLLDEWHAEALYAQVIKDHGDVRPFSNIIEAERRHADFLLQLYTTYNLVVPARTSATQPSFATVTDACSASKQAEIANAGLYDVALAQTLPDDVRLVVTRNRAASLDRHLPAFDRCASGATMRGQGRGTMNGQGRGMGSGRGMSSQNGPPAGRGMTNGRGQGPNGDGICPRTGQPAGARCPLGSGR